MGFSLAALLALLLLTRLIRMLKSPVKSNVVWTAAISASLIFISPVMLYPLLVLMAWAFSMFLKDLKKNLKRITAYIAAAIIFTFIFYLPAVKNTGIRQLVTGNINFLPFGLKVYNYQLI